MIGKTATLQSGKNTGFGADVFGYDVFENGEHVTYTVVVGWGLLAPMFTKILSPDGKELRRWDNVFVGPNEAMERVGFNVSISPWLKLAAEELPGNGAISQITKRTIEPSMTWNVYIFPKPEITSRKPGVWKLDASTIEGALQEVKELLGMVPTAEDPSWKFQEVEYVEIFQIFSQIRLTNKMLGQIVKDQSYDVSPS